MMIVALRLPSTQITFQSALDIAAGVPSLLKLLKKYMQKPSAIESQDDSPADSSQEPAVARLSQVILVRLELP